MPRKKKEEAEAVVETQAVLPDLSIGMIGHVDHGKTTLVKALSGKWTDTHSEEIKRGITIRLGYADFSIYKCESCPEPECYSTTEECRKCKGKAVLQRKISLVDAPGHESLMATMLCGANIMDGALLLISAAEECPQPQTMEHLQALQIIGVKNLIIMQNKIDLVSEEKTLKNYGQIQNFLKGTEYENAPIIPISALHNINTDALLMEMQNRFKTPERELDKPPLMFVARSFDINKPGATPEKMQGGVLGGVLKQGILKVGDEITILPGYETTEKNQKVWKALTSKITGIVAGGQHLVERRPGGTFGILTLLDPSVVKSDQLAGSVVGTTQLPKVLSELSIESHLLERVVGAKDKLVVEPLKKGEWLMLNVNSSATVGAVKEISKNTIKLALKRPVAAEPGSRITISRNLGQRWRLIGYGVLK